MSAAVRHPRAADRGDRRPDRIARVAIILAGVAAVLLVAIVVLRFTVWADPAAPAAGHAAAPPVAEPAPGQPAVEPGPSASATPAPVPVLADQPTRLRIPSIGLRANVGAMHVRGPVDPPTPASAYWLSDYGTVGPAATNTAYIAGHTWRGGNGVFNPLLHVADSSYTVHPGDTVIVDTPGGSYTYDITDVELYEKATLGDQAGLWQNVPGRLVLVTCFQYNGGTSSHQNLVVYAQLHGAGS
jgi:sortase (surface protein transpeptidase)